MKHWSPAPKFLTLTLLTTALGCLVAGCGPGDAGDGSDAGADGVACTTYSQVTIWPKCTTCHSSKLVGDTARMMASANVDFDTYDAAKMQGQQAQAWVSTGLMPPEGNPPATDAEKASLKAWVDCGMPK